MAPGKFDAILIDPDLNSRMRLKQATSSVHNFGHVGQVGELNEAMQKLRNNDSCDVIFISYRFDQNEVINFIRQAKETSRGQDVAYIQVLKSNSGDSSTVAQNVIGGADGLLFEPYSVDYLLEITNLAARVKKERSGAREKAAIQVLVQDVVNQVDQLYFLKSSEMDTTRAQKKLAESLAVLKSLGPESMQTYYDLAVNAFEAAPVATNVSKYKKYAGVSERAKKRLEKKVQAELEAKATSSGSK
jgi:response regulator RpfG family c-di-GMP phosphodiesterase